MKKKRGFLLPLLMAIVMMAMSPTRMWAQGLEVDDDFTISEDVTYDYIYVFDDKLTIEEGVTVTCNNIVIDNQGGYAKVFNYGTIVGDVIINANADDYCFANHGVVDGNVYNDDGKYWYNTGTVTGEYYQDYIADCEHLSSEDLAYNITATCQHGGGTKSRCYVCGYISYSESVADHSMPETFTDGIKKCANCSYEEYDKPSKDTDNKTYLLANTGNLYWFRDFVNTKTGNTYPNLSACAKLTANIVVNDGEFDEDGNFTATGASEASTPRSWTPIGPDPYDDPYTGTFDGDGHTICGLYCNDSNEGNFGLFRYCGSGATVKGVGIVNCYFNCGYGNIGAICYKNNGTIDGCYSSGTITSTDNYNAGLCSQNFGTISNCYSTCSISAPESVGGICVTNYGTIKNCYFTGPLNNATNKGGICYINKVFNGSAGTVTNCYTTFDTAILNNQTASGTKVYCVETKNAEAFSKGEIAYMLNGSVNASGTWSAGTGTPVWYQKLGDDGDDYPVLKKASDGSNTVYYGYDGCTLSYANAALSQTQGDHNFDSKTLCDQDQKHDVAGFYYYLCDKCGAKSEHTCVVIKDYAPDEGNAKNLELTVTTDGETTTYSTTETIALTDANQFANVNVAFSTPSAPTYTREMTTDWGTVVLPFEVSTQTDDYDLYRCETLLDGRLVMRILPVNEALPAGYPAFVRKKTDAESITFTGTGNVVNTAPPSSENNGNTILLKGAYTASQLNNGYADYIYFIYNDKFWNVNQLSDGQEVTIFPFHAYIQEAISEEGPGNMNAKLMIVVDDETTDLRDLQLDNLQGTIDGKFIENGKVVIVRNGKKYNVNGQEVK